jgi:hypothetical protein
LDILNYLFLKSGPDTFLIWISCGRFPYYAVSLFSAILFCFLVCLVLIEYWENYRDKLKIRMIISFSREVEYFILTGYSEIPDLFNPVRDGNVLNWVSILLKNSIFLVCLYSYGISS